MITTPSGWVSRGTQLQQHQVVQINSKEASDLQLASFREGSNLEHHAQAQAVSDLRQALQGKGSFHKCPGQLQL